MNNKTWRSTFFVLALCLAMASTHFGQEETSATITGQITDSAGAVIVNATVTVTNVSTGIVRTVQSNDEGSFTVTPLSPGDYAISVEQQGFKKYCAEHHLKRKGPQAGPDRVGSGVRNRNGNDNHRTSSYPGQFDRAISCFRQPGGRIAAQ